MTRLGGEKRAYGMALLACSPAAALYALDETRDPDLFWHLRTAQLALETKSFLPVDPFSFSFAGAPWEHKDLLAEMALYLGYAQWGFAWFWMLKFVLALTLGAACLLMARENERRPLLLVVALLGIVSCFWLVERPNAFSTVLFGLALGLAERARRAQADPSPHSALRALLPLLALNYLWTWVHRFALLGHALLAALFLVACGAALLGRKALLFGPTPSRAYLRHAGVLALASPLLAVLNPSGTLALTSGITMAAHPELRRQFWEWKRAGLAELWEAFPGAVLVTALVLCSIGWRVWWELRHHATDQVLEARASRDEDPIVVLAWHGALLLALLAMTADSVRWVAYLAVAAVFVGVRLLAEKIAGWEIPRGSVVLLGVLALAMVVWRREGSPLRMGEDPHFSPRGAVEFAEREGLSGQVANCFDLGGYLIWTAWPRVRVLVDGRNELIYPPDFVVRALLAEHNADAFAEMRAHDEVTWAMAVNAPRKVGYGFLARDPNWAMVYWSDTAAVYVRRDVHTELAQRMAFRYLDPYDLPGSTVRAYARERGSGEVVAGLRAELTRALEGSPDSVRAGMAQAALHHLSGNPRDRNAVLEHLRVLTGGDPEIDQFGRWLSQMGRASQ